MNRKNPLISIVIPTYERPVYLKRAVESVLHQIYPHYELIIVSDNDKGSVADLETIQMLQPYLKLPQVSYLPSDHNQGSCYARNRGLSVAKGEYINFLDDDDEFLPEKLQKQVELLRQLNTEPAVIGCQAQILNNQEKVVRIEKPKYNPDDIFYSELLRNLGTTSLNLIRTDVCREAGGFQYIESSQEHLFLIHVFAQEATFACVDDILVRIHQHAGKRISNNPKKPLGTLKLTKIMESYYVRLTPEQVLNVRAARMKEDIYAYCFLREYDKAKSLFRKRRKIRPLDLETLKIMIRIFQISRTNNDHHF